MGKLILLRHGESQWNSENRFTGWIDIGLTEKGKKEAYEAGKLLRGIPIDFGFTSVLIRAIDTLTEALRGADQELVPIAQDAALNERMYGDLQGLNKAECAEKFGADQVKIWRRSYDVPPPNGESLKDTAARTLPYFEKNILPLVKEGKNVLVSAHGNSLRAIVMDLDKLSKEEVVELNIPNAEPIVYEIDESGKILSKVLL
ncbi:MAG: 2,3-bisphosphoglycerate-dependent phosphoglycerate mutase [Bacteroidota bacterium]|nr:2,3-bisphosphoglycerate-dependent phosphoglycerate mutase [Bacteroidota bacterium]MDP4230355.1 2,3-bisphosphoglycerate-dependent phosphoglycerate mutase [Bacteroidota bacterium]MDP4236251.1 2,3-bisphosphoglycerate-dependent phosphoglycerate mutase [Bacteroidota bacterium]